MVGESLSDATASQNISMRAHPLFKSVIIFIFIYIHMYEKICVHVYIDVYMNVCMCVLPEVLRN